MLLSSSNKIMSTKKTYFAKFLGLPFKYDYIKASNSVIARRHFEQFRDDVIIIDQDVTALSLREYHNQQYQQINIQDNIYRQYDLAKGEMFYGDKVELRLVRQSYLTSLKETFAHFPGGNKGNLFEAKGTFTFTIKSTPALAKFIIDNNIIKDLSPDDVKKQVLSAKHHFPIYIFTARKDNGKTQKVEQLKDSE